MPIQPSSAHPSWCDPRLCATEAHNVDHRSAPTAWKIGAADVLVTVGLSRFDCTEPESPHAGPVLARLGLRDLVGEIDGAPRVVESDLSAADARLLAASLVCVAEQLEAEQRRAEVTR